MLTKEKHMSVHFTRTIMMPKIIDPELHNACRVITSALRPTPLPAQYRLTGMHMERCPYEYNAE